MRVLISLLLALSLTACASILAPPARVIYDTKQSFDAALIIMDGYAKLPRCGQPTSPPLCSDQVRVSQTLQAALDANAALNVAEGLVRSSASATDINAALATAQVEVDFLQSLVATLQAH